MTRNKIPIDWLSSVLGSLKTFSTQGIYPSASKVSREVANLTKRKNPHTPLFVCKVANRAGAEGQNNNIKVDS